MSPLSKAQRRQAGIMASLRSKSMKKNLQSHLLICMCWSDLFPSPFTVFTQGKKIHKTETSLKLNISLSEWAAAVGTFLRSVLVHYCTKPCRSQILTHLSVSIANSLCEGTPSLSVLHFHWCIVGQQQVCTLYKRYRQKGMQLSELLKTLIDKFY